MDRLPAEEPSLRDEILVGRDRIAFKLSSEDTQGEVAVAEVTIPPGGGPPMLHRHDPFELYRVLGGELAIYLEGHDGAVRRTVVGAGEALPIAGGLEHTVRNESGTEAKALAVYSPGAPMERFARAAGDLARDGGPDPEAVLATAAEHGIEITRSVEEALADAGSETSTSAQADAGYLTIARFSGESDRLLADYRNYSGVMDEVGRDHGLILHAAARTDDGVVVVNLWPSKEGSEAAALDSRRQSVVEEAEITPNQVRREHLELERVVVFDGPGLPPTTRSR